MIDDFFINISEKDFNEMFLLMWRQWDKTTIRENISLHDHQKAYYKHIKNHEITNIFGNRQDGKTILIQAYIVANFIKNKEALNVEIFLPLSSAKRHYISNLPFFYNNFMKNKKIFFNDFADEYSNLVSFNTVNKPPYSKDLSNTIFVFDQYLEYKGNKIMKKFISDIMRYPRKKIIFSV